MNPISATEVRFRVEVPAASGDDWKVAWSTPMPVLQWAIGPRPSGSGIRKTAFSGVLPYSATELEQFGNDVMHYTLGAMGDDEANVDLSGAEWGWNLERLLVCVDQSRLRRSQVVRLKKLLGWLRGVPWV